VPYWNKAKLRDIAAGFFKSIKVGGKINPILFRLLVYFRR